MNYELIDIDSPSHNNRAYLILQKVIFEMWLAFEHGKTVSLAMWLNALHKWSEEFVYENQRLEFLKRFVRFKEEVRKKRTPKSESAKHSKPLSQDVIGEMLNSVEFQALGMIGAAFVMGILILIMGDGEIAIPEMQNPQETHDFSHDELELISEILGELGEVSALQHLVPK